MPKIPCKIASGDKPPKGTVNIKTGIFASKWQQAKGFMSSSDRYLEDANPVFKPLVKQLRAAHFGENGEQYYKYKMMKRWDDAFSGYKGKLEDVSDALDGKPVKDPNAMRIAKKVRPLFDEIHQEATNRGITAKGGGPLNKIQDYFPLITQDDTFGASIKDSIKSVYGTKKSNLGERLFGSEDVPMDPEGGFSGVKDYPQDVEFGNLQETRQGTGNPNKPQLLNRNPHQVFRKYVEGSARVMFRKPVVDSWNKALKQMPESFDKQMAKYLMEHYAGTAKEHPLWKLDKAIGKMTAKSTLGFSTHLQVLHAMRVVMMGLPEIGMKHTIKGLTQYLTDLPKGKNHNELIEAGLVQEVPKSMRTMDERINNISNYGDIGNSFAKSVMLKANQSRLKELKDPEWKQNAIYATSQQEGYVNPTSPIRAIQEMPKVASQFKLYLGKYGENVARSVFNKDKTLAQKMKSAGGFIITASALKEIGDALGVPLYHVSGVSLLQPLSSASRDFLMKVGKDLSQGKVGDALFEITRASVPGGRNLIRNKKGGGYDFRLPLITEPGTAKKKESSLP